MYEIGDKIKFELEDQLFDKNLRTVRARIIRAYPRNNALAFDCVDLDNENLNYTINADEKFIRFDD